MFGVRLSFPFLIGQLLSTLCKMKGEKICLDFQKANSESISGEVFHPFSNKYFSRGACPQTPLGRLCWCGPPAPSGLDPTLSLQLTHSQSLV